MNNLKTRRQFFSKSWIVVLSIFLVSACGERLTEQRAVELVRLNYKQQNSLKGEGKWIVDTVQVKSINKLKTDTIEVYMVIAIANGLFQFPLVEGSTGNYTQSFIDTLQFVAKKKGNLWMADDWTIIGGSNE